MCKKVVRAEVHGPAEGNDCCPYFLGITKQMEERQDRWHKSPVPGDFPRDGSGSLIGRVRRELRGEDQVVEECVGKDKEEPLCLRMVVFAKRLVENFDWS